MKSVERHFAEQARSPGAPVSPRALRSESTRASVSTLSQPRVLACVGHGAVPAPASCSLDAPPRAAVAPLRARGREGTRTYIRNGEKVHFAGIVETVDSWVREWQLVHLSIRY